MGNLLCIGLFLRFRAIPTPRAFDISDYGLPAGVHMDVLDRDFLPVPCRDAC